ncbi:hypothetical protein [Parasphingorhabdus cellanae]|uniref:Glycine zipper family protein n=1 Tax=Parasphingorhabdus cellanae TaxID=2806553 RepID=A0ABX7TAY7_9SPHN|nr:hypothetical protein [Parasphingorhabdus cellanae]QTD57944.1 hypothetical protein J4G78_12275 [Parasphingorhabdus cellanae]
MTDGQKPTNGANKNAGGFFLAAGCIIGTVGGGLLGQPSIGLLGGLAAGALIAIAIWYFDR